jgi:hypothetical protein
MCICTRLTSALEVAAPPNNSNRPARADSEYLFIIALSDCLKLTEGLH